MRSRSAPGRYCGPRRRSDVRSLLPARLAQPFQRRFEIALRIDEEVAGGHDHIAVREPVHDLDVTVAVPANLDLPGFEPSLALVDQHEPPAAAVDHGLFRHSEHGLVT